MSAASVRQGIGADRRAFPGSPVSIADPDHAATAAYARLHDADRRHGGLAPGERIDLLRRLEQELLAERTSIVQAIDADFGGRSADETLVTEVLGVLNAARYARRRLRRWARPRRVRPDAPFWPARVRVVPQPLGVVGVVAPWNYPLLLALSPLVCALAAGNRIAVKPSELTPRTSAVIARLLERALGPEIAQVVQGGPAIAAAFVRQPFDHLLFTGGDAHGRAVALAAAANLTPVTLELGGKCPAIVLADADLEAAAGAIVVGKGLSAGQTCIAPDHVLLVGVDLPRFRDALRRAYRRHFPNGLPTAVIAAQAERVARLAAGADLEPLGEGLEGAHGLRLAVDPDPVCALLREEIFGPILPLVQVDGLDSAITRLRDGPSPLAVYLFTRDRRAIATVLDASRSGALVVNGTVQHAAINALPFGGVGASGMGRYHGRSGFETFSNMRACVEAPRFSLARLCNPPYGPRTRRLIDRLLR